jgi:sulfate adenylyltransferase subunit 1 (EFTu-like GTPase family)
MSLSLRGPSVGPALRRRNHLFSVRKRSSIQSVERSQARSEEITAGTAAGFTMTEQIYVKRGEMRFAGQTPPKVTAG